MALEGEDLVTLISYFSLTSRIQWPPLPPTYFNPTLCPTILTHATRSFEHVQVLKCISVYETGRPTT